MNILFTSGFPIEPITGGVQRVTSVLTKEFIKNGHQVNYLILSNKKKDYDYDINHFFLPTSNLSKKENIAYFLELLEVLKVDVIINQTGVFKEKVDFVANAKKRNIKILSVHHNCIACLIDNYKNILKGSKYGFFLKLIDFKLLWDILLYRNKLKYGNYFKNAIEKSDKLVLLSNSYIRELNTYIKTWPKEKVLAIDNPIPFEFQNIDIEKKENRLIYVGRIEYTQKQAHLLIPIWEQISIKFPDWHLDIVGDGSYLTQLKAEALNRKLKNIHFHGYTDPRPFLEKAKIFLMTSSFEGYGMVIVEAQAYGVVPVAFNSFPILSYMFMDFKAGVGVEPFSIEDYTQKVIDLIENEQKINDFVTFGKGAVERFLPTKIAQDWENLFKS